MSTPAPAWLEAGLSLGARSTLRNVLLSLQELDWWRENYYPYAFNPLPLQKKFLESRALERYILGGNQSGKTVTAAVDFGLEVLGLKGLLYPGFPDDGKPRDGWCVALDHNLARPVIVKKLKRVLGGFNAIRKFYEKDQIFVLSNGAVITVKSCDSGEEKFQSVEVDRIWFDEVPPEGIYGECRPRLVARGGLLTMSATPTRGIDWLYTRLYERWLAVTAGAPVDADLGDGQVVFFCQLDMEDNIYLPEKARKALVAGFLDDDEVAMRKRGHFVQLKGKVFKNFCADRNIIDPIPIPADWPKFRGMDWGLSAPAACLWLAIDPATNEMHAYREFYEREWETEQICAAIKGLSGGEVYEFSVLDPACWYRTGDKEESGAWNTRANEYLNAGLDVMKGNNDVAGGIDLLRRWIGSEKKPARLKIHRNCRNFIRELTNLTYHKERRAVGPKRGEQLADVDDHLIDCARYVVMADPVAKMYDAGWETAPGDGFGPGAPEADRTQVPRPHKVPLPTPAGEPAQHRVEVGWTPAPDGYDGFDSGPEPEGL